MRQKMNVNYSHKFTERFLIFLTLASFLCCLLSLLRDLTIEKREVINYLTIIFTAVYAVFAFGIIAILRWPLRVITHGTARRALY